MAHYGDALTQKEAPVQEFAPDFDAAATINRVEFSQPADPLNDYYTAAQMREESGLFVTPARSPSPELYAPLVRDGKLQPNLSLVRSSGVPVSPTCILAEGCF